MRFPSKRRVFWLSLVAACALSLGWAAGVEPGQLRVRSEEMTSPHWPAAVPKLRIVFMADLHVGAPYVPIARVDKLVAIANRAEPDLVLLGGDYIAHVLFGEKVACDAIARSDVCACFYCKRTFPPTAITEWIDESERFPDGATALCPHCHIDAVLPSDAIALRPELLAEMRMVYFDS